MTSEQLDARIARLLKYCSDQSILIHPSITPKYIPGRGLGIYATADIPANAKLITVPTKQIFTTASIPDSFLPQSIRKGLAVHAQLAAFFAFGSEEDLNQYRPWLETWPKLEDFVEGMPLFWGDQLLRCLTKATDETTKAGRLETVAPKSQDIMDRVTSLTTSTDDTAKMRMSSQPINLSPALSGTFAAHLKGSKWNDGLLSALLNRLTTHIVSLHKALPHLSLLTSDKTLSRFLHAWSCVNSRCFYYIPSVSPRNTRPRKLKPQPPTDPNEAMALMPYIDLFNHIAPNTTNVTTTHNFPFKTHCKVKYNPRVFEVTTQHPHPANAEINLTYGEHNNDTLWTEYGFLLPTGANTSDSLDIFELVLHGLSTAQKDLLDRNGYLGAYTLNTSGEVCYRTEVAAWCTVLSEREWTRSILHQDESHEQKQEEAENEAHKEQDQDQNEIQRENEIPADLHTRYTTRLNRWLSRVRECVDENIVSLERLSEREMLIGLGTSSVVRGSVPELSAGERVTLVRRRRDMAVLRWRQVGDMADRGVEKLRQEDVEQ